MKFLVFDDDLSYIKIIEGRSLSEVSENNDNSFELTGKLKKELIKEVLQNFKEDIKLNLEIR